MTEAGWTREKPTVSGLYWLRNNPKHAPEVVRVSVMSNSNVTVERIGSCDVTFEPDNAEFKGPITPDSYHQGRVAALDEVERYMAMRLRLAEASLATEILAGNEVKQGRERAAIAELHGMQRHVSDIKEYNAQAQEGGGGDESVVQR